MSAWRRKALEILPEYRQIIETADNVVYLWFKLSFAFKEGIEKNNNDSCSKILEYAFWCTSDEAGDVNSQTQQAVYCGFMEDIAREKYFPFFQDWFRPYQFEKYKGW